jgi:hypothetical protein
MLCNVSETHALGLAKHVEHAHGLLVVPQQVVSNGQAYPRRALRVAALEQLHARRLHQGHALIINVP